MVRDKVLEDAMANYFALCLLMPEEEYRKVFAENLLEDGKAVDTSKIAKHFGVTVTDACIRGIGLGLIESW